MASNKRTTEYDNISIRENVFASGFSGWLTAYASFMPKELSAFLPFYSALSSLIGIFVCEVRAKLTVLSS